MHFSYEKDFKSHRSDGRHTYTLAAYMDYLRNLKPALSFPESASAAEFSAWQKKVRDKAWELLLLPPLSEQPAPVLLSVVQRDGYRVEKWEFYPDDYSAVPCLMLIPDKASASTPLPAVFCLPGSVGSKEFLADEPLLEGRAGSFAKYPERNKIAKHVVENGMIAIAFDNPATAECAIPIDAEVDYGANARVHLCHGLSQAGFSYAGVSVFQKLCFLDFLKTLSFVDQGKIGVAAHSLGTVDAIFLGLLCDEIKAIIVNDFVGDDRERYVSVTEEDEREMTQNCGNWHEIFGIFRWFARPDLCAALAPKYLALNEGGAEHHLDKVRAAYRINGCEDHLLISYYPKYKDASSRTMHGVPPLYGLKDKEYYEWHYVDAPDHSFRVTPSIELLNKAFGEKK